MSDSIRRDEAPFASHALYTQEGVLDDSIPGERRHGIECGFAWRERADLTVVYTDLGISSGMELGIEDAHVKGLPVEYRSLPDWNRLQWQRMGQMAYAKIGPLEFDVFPSSDRDSPLMWSWMVRVDGNPWDIHGGYTSIEAAMADAEEEEKGFDYE